MALFSSVEESRKRRGRLADAILMQGMDASPVQHPLQGVDRLVKALVGGYMGYKLDQEDKDRLKKFGDAFMSAIGPQTGTPAAPGTPSPDISTAMGPGPSATTSSLGQKAADFTNSFGTLGQKAADFTASLNPTLGDTADQWAQSLTRPASPPGPGTPLPPLGRPGQGADLGGMADRWAKSLPPMRPPMPTLGQQAGNFLPPLGRPRPIPEVPGLGAPQMAPGDVQVPIPPQFQPPPRPPLPPTDMGPLAPYLNGMPYPRGPAPVPEPGPMAPPQSMGAPPAPPGAPSSYQEAAPPARQQMASADTVDQIMAVARKHESGNQYGITGPKVVYQGGRVDYPYGAYQVMGANIGPWTQEVLGRRMTPQEFLADPKAQDAVARAKMSQYLKQTGSVPDVFAMWASGRPLAASANNHDLVFGTRVADTVAKRMADMPQLASAAPTSMTDAGAPRPVPGLQTAQATPATSATTSNIPPQTLKLMGMLVSSGEPELMQMAMQLYTQYQKPTEFGFQVLPNGTVIRTDPRTGSVTPIMEGVTKPQWVKIGVSPQTGEDEYGFVDPNKGTVTPYRAPSPTPGASPAQSPIQPAPPGVNPKVWRDTQTKELATGGSEDQRKAAAFMLRATQSNGIMNRLAAGGFTNPNFVSWLSTDKPYESLVLSDPEKLYLQAARDFIAAKLRRESGAVINADEFKKDYMTLFPMPYDSPAVRAQKEASRARVIQEFKIQAGPAARLVPDQGAAAQPLPPDRSQLKAGETYQTSRGPARWNGQAFEQ